MVHRFLTFYFGLLPSVPHKTTSLYKYIGLAYHLSLEKYEPAPRNAATPTTLATPGDLFTFWADSCVTSLGDWPRAPSCNGAGLAMTSHRTTVPPYCLSNALLRKYGGIRDRYCYGSSEVHRQQLRLDRERLRLDRQRFGLEPAAAQAGPAAALAGPAAALAGPAAAQAGPAATRTGPAAAQTGPTVAQAGPAAVRAGTGSGWTGRGSGWTGSGSG